MARGWQGKSIPLGCLFLGISWSGSAHAEEKARLVYVRGVGTDECPAEVDLRLLVMARLGYDPFSPQASRVVLSRIELSGAQLTGSLEVIDQGGMATGRRELTAKVGRCAELARALALSISLAIDPERASQPLPRQPTPPTPSTPPAAGSEPPRAAEAKPEPAVHAAPTPQAPRPRAFVSAAAAASAGSLPGPALGGAASLGWRFGFGSLTLEGRALQGFSSQLAPRGSLTGSLFLGGLSVCWARGVWSVCGLGVAGAQRLGTSGVTSPLTSDALFLGAGPRVAWALPLGPRLEAVASLEALVNLQRNGAELSGKEVWRAPPASATLSFGLRTSFL